MSKGYTSVFYNPWLIFALLVDFLFVEFSCERLLNNWTDGNWQGPYTNSILNYFVAIGFIVLLTIIILGRCESKYKLSSSTLRQLINNALGYKWLTLFILFFFMMHFSWTIDAGYEIFVDTKYSWRSWLKIFHIIIPASGMFIAALLIPMRQEKKKSLSEADILLSSFSVSKSGYLLPNNLDLFFKPFFCGVQAHNNPDKLEQLAGIKKILIIPSTSLLKAPIQMDSIDNDWGELENNLWENNERVRTIYSRIAAVEKQNAKDVYHNTFIAAIEKYNKALQSNNLNPNFDNLKEFLSAILPLEFIFSELPVNYDQFNQVFKVASLLLKEHEKQDSKTLIHISPGTSIPAGALTALGVKRNRIIIYTLQNKENTVASVDMDADSMDDWFSELISDRDGKDFES